MMNIAEYITHLKNTTLVADLLSYEGPLLSLTSDDKGNLFIYKWVGLDKINNAHKWVVFAVSFENLSKFIFKKISELSFMEAALNEPFAEGATYLAVNIDGNLEYSDAQIYSKQTLPEAFKSEEGIFFEEKYCEDKKALYNFLAESIVHPINSLKPKVAIKETFILLLLEKHKGKEILNKGITINSFNIKHKSYLANSIEYTSLIKKNGFV